MDIVGLRAGNSAEKAMGVEFIVDDAFFEICKSEMLPTPKATTFGIVAEVRGSKTRKMPKVEYAGYARPFLGGAPIVRVSFVEAVSPLRLKNDVVIVSMNYAAGWIGQRIAWMNDQKWKFTKSGSWSLSEDYLADLLYLSGHARATATAHGLKGRKTDCVFVLAD